MRGDHYKQSVTNGLQVDSIHGDVKIPADELQAFQNTQDIGRVDWIVVALKSSSLDDVPALIEPLLKPGKTRVLTIMNGLIEEDLILKVKDHVGESAVNNNNLKCCGALYGGMALVCSNRLGPGHISHTYAGKLSAGVAAYHDSNTNESECLQAFLDFWKPVQRVETVGEASILSGRWRKNVWNLPFNGISVAMGGITVDKMVTNPDLRRLADLVMDETIAAANADLQQHGLSDERLFLGDADKEAMFALSDGMGPYRPSTMIDLVERNPMEVQYLFRKPVERAKELGVPVPHLETLVAQIGAFQNFYDLY
jgi:2-dehydropantoate 2-reductase